MKLKKLTLVVILLIGAGALVSCSKTSLDEDVEDAAERTGAAVEDLGDAAGDAVEDAADTLR